MSVTVSEVLRYTDLGHSVPVQGEPDGVFTGLVVVPGDASGGLLVGNFSADRDDILLRLLALHSRSTGSADVTAYSANLAADLLTEATFILERAVTIATNTLLKTVVPADGLWTALEEGAAVSSYFTSDAVNASVNTDLRIQIMGFWWYMDRLRRRVRAVR